MKNGFLDESFVVYFKQKRERPCIRPEMWSVSEKDILIAVLEQRSSLLNPVASGSEIVQARKR